MIGVPNSFQTKQDYKNAVDYAISEKTDIDVMIAKLERLKSDVYMNVLKDSSKDVPADEQTPDDYEQVENPACEKNKLGFSDSEIDQLIEQLERAK